MTLSIEVWTCKIWGSEALTTASLAGLYLDKAVTQRPNWTRTGAAATLHSSQLARETDTRPRRCGISDAVIEDIETALPWPF